MKQLIIICTLLPLVSFSKNIVITGYVPWENQNLNTSEVLVQELSRIFKFDDKVNIHSCLLPVVYKVAAKKVIECIESAPFEPELVISFGQGAYHRRSGKGCFLRASTRVQNYVNSSAPDNNGTVIRKKKILQFGRKYQYFSYQLRSAVESMNKYRDLVLMSEKTKYMGTFVCSETAYLVNHEISKRYDYGFIHIPEKTCSNQKELHLAAAELLRSF